MVGPLSYVVKNYIFSISNYQKGPPNFLLTMKRILKHLHETRIGDSSMRIDSTIIFRKNEEAWRGKISEMRTLRNGKTFYFVGNAVSDSGKIHSFDVEGKDIIRSITDLEIEHGFYG
jgi:hypothetical protein